MTLFLNMTTRNKLLLGFGLLILIMLAVVQTAYREMRAMESFQQQLYERDFADATDLAAIRAYSNAMRADVQTMMLFAQREEQAAWHDKVKDRSQHVELMMQRLLQRPHADQAFLAKLRQLQGLVLAYQNGRDNEQIPLIYQGKLKEARDMATGAQARRFDQVRSSLMELGDFAEKHAATAVEASSKSMEAAVKDFVSMMLGAILLAAIMTFLLTRVIADPLKEIADVARRVAEGDLTANIAPTRRTDEVGILAQVFQGMISGMRELTKEIREGMSVLTASSAEILATTTQVASATAQTATAVSETTTTVEEVKQTVLLSSQKARQVSDSAQKSAQVSESGRQAVEAMLEGMLRIREQTASTAESIARLNEQSQAIGEIIAAVNDLTEQSNVLAVNAAIEAAKIGEHGKGFAVVAQEIKSLAEQSKQATAQVRVILGEIQKATGAAVMATDLSGKAVESGTRQSDSVGETIRMLSESINEAAQVALQIAASTQQQQVGMDQVTLAMENIKQASTQNMAGTKQAEVAAQSLHDLGLRLQQMVERYKT